MEIAGELREYRSLMKEIKRLNTQKLKLNNRLKFLGDKILDYLDEVDEPGIRCGDIVVLRDEKNKRARKKEKDKEKDVCSVIQRYVRGNDRMAKKVYEELLEAMRGEEVDARKLTVKKSNY